MKYFAGVNVRVNAFMCVYGYMILHDPLKDEHVRKPMV